MKKELLTIEQWVTREERESDIILDESVLKYEYDDMLDECNPEIKIGSLTYSPSQVLKSVDETAYDCGFNDYTDNDYTEFMGGYIRKTDMEDLESDYEKYKEELEEEEEEEENEFTKE